MCPESSGKPREVCPEGGVFRSPGGMTLSSGLCTLHPLPTWGLCGFSKVREENRRIPGITLYYGIIYETVHLHLITSYALKWRKIEVSWSLPPFPSFLFTRCLYWLFGTQFQASRDVARIKIVHVCVLGHVWLFGTPRTIARQGLLSMGFSRQERWSKLPFSPPGDLLDPGTEPASLASPALADGFFTTAPPGKPLETYTPYSDSPIANILPYVQMCGVCVCWGRVIFFIQQAFIFKCEMRHICADLWIQLNEKSEFDSLKWILNIP